MIVAVQQSQPSISIDTRASVSIESQGGVLVIQMAGGLPGPQGPAGTGNGSFPSPPDQTGTWAPIFVAGVLQWFEVVLIAGGGVTGQDGSAAAVGTELSGQTGTASATGTGATTATGSAATSEAGAASSTGTGTTAATGSEGSAEAGTATSFVLSPGTALATGAEVTAETGTATATGTGTTGATGTQATSEYGTATASATSSGSATATSSEGTSQTGTASATGSGITAATGTQGTSETGTATASGGGGGATITENFDTAIALTYAGAQTYPANMALSTNIQGWTIANSGTNPGTFDVYDNFVSASCGTGGTLGFSGNGLGASGCYTEDADLNLIGRSGYKLTKTWTGPFSAGTFSIKYKIGAGQVAHTIKVNGTSVGALTQNGTYQTATISVDSTMLSAYSNNIFLEIECAPTTNQAAAIVGIALDNIAYA